MIRVVGVRVTSTLRPANWPSVVERQRTMEARARTSAGSSADGVSATKTDRMASSMGLERVTLGHFSAQAASTQVTAPGSRARVSARQRSRNWAWVS